MKLAFKAGTTSKDINIFIQDNSVSTGAGLTGLVYNSGSLTAYYHRQGASSATAITLATKTVGTWATGGFVAVDGTNCPGLYELGIPDAALASGATWVIIMLKGATNMAPVVLEIELLATDNQDATRMGLSALPNAAAAANGGLPTVDASNAVKVQSGTGSNQISLSSGLVTLASVTHTGAVIPTVTTATNVTTVNGLASGVITATSIAADAITAAKIADGAIDAATFAAGAINAAAIATDAITAAKIAADAIGASELAADAVAEIQSGLATPTNITAGTITTVTNLTNAPTSGDFTATMKSSITANVPTAATIAAAVWAVLTSTLTTASTIGKLITDNLNATISSVYNRLGAPTSADLATDIAALQADTDDIQTRIPAGLNSGNITAHVVSIANNAITAASIATNAIDADALAADAVTEIGTGISVSAPTVDDIDTKLTAMHGSGAWGTATGFATPTDVDDSTATVVASIGALNNLSAAQVWAAGTRTLTSGGAPTTTEIWSAATRTLTSPTPGSTTPPAVSGTQLAIKKATSFDVTVTGMTIPSNWSKVYWTVKSNTNDVDSAAVLQIVKTNGGGAGDGLLYLNGAAATGHASEGSLTVDQAGGNVTIAITDDYTAQINAGTYTSDFKVITSASKSTQLAVCPVAVDSAVTLAVS